jgi:hypothetical protein
MLGLLTCLTTGSASPIRKPDQLTRTLGNLFP